jgi:hypothetical protein
MVIQAISTKIKAWGPQKIRLLSTPKQQFTTYKSYTTMIHLEDDDGRPLHVLLVIKLSLCADSYMS